MLLGSKALQNMKDSNNHSISKKQQEKFLQMGENLTISYALAGNTKELSGAADHLVSLTGHEENEQQTVYLPCKITAVTEMKISIFLYHRRRSFAVRWVSRLKLQKFI